MRRVSLMFAIALAATISLGAGDSDPPAGHAEKHATRDGNSPDRAAGAERTAVERALTKPITFDFVKTPLKDVAAKLSTDSGINIVLDEKAITDAGLSPEVQISRAMRQLPLRSALQLTLSDLELGFLEIDDNVLLITTKVNAADSVVTQTYNVGDLAPTVHNSKDGADSLVPLIDLITAVVTPTSWSDAGGRGSIGSFDSQLIITQTRELHAQIVDLLTTLRRVRDEPEKFREGGITDPTSPEGKIREQLQTRRDFKFHDTPLKDVVEGLKKSGLEIQFDAKAISDAGGSLDVPITFSAKQVRLATALKLMLLKYELTYMMDHEVLLITTESSSKEHVVTRIYSIADLLPETPAGSADENSAYEELANTITATVVPTSWVDAGGTGSLQPFPSLKILVCTQSEDAHDEIVKLLSMLRAHRGAAPPEAHVESKSKDELVTRVYQLSPGLGDATGEYLAVVQKLVEPTPSWTARSNYLGKVPGAIIARCSPAVQFKIRELLLALDALPPQPGKGGAGRLNGGVGGGGFGAGGGSGGGAF